MSSVSLFFTGIQSEKARKYSRIPKSRNPQAEDLVWVPLSLVEHTSKQPAKPGEEWAQHVVKLPDWFVEEKKL